MRGGGGIGGGDDGGGGDGGDGDERGKGLWCMRGL